MNDNGVREIHGATPMAGARDDPFTIREKEHLIVIHQGYTEKLKMTPDGARFLARKLYRLARRIEKRTASVDRSGEAGETGTGSTEGESAVPQADAKPDSPSNPHKGGSSA